MVGRTVSGSDPLTPLDSGTIPGQQPRLPRKNLLLSATIDAAGVQAPVRIRNLSGSGAMLDGPALPDSGTRLMLRRSTVEMGGLVVWRNATRCGVRFDDSVVSVDEWVAGARSRTFAGQQGQARVDAIQDAVRSGAVLSPEPTANATPLPGAALDSRIVEELGQVRLLLDGLGEELVEDPQVVQQHMQALQNLDRASQILDHLAAILGATDRLGAVQNVAMQDLKARLLRQPDV
jgi:hypothetical protein